MLKDSLFSGRREFHELDVEQFGVVIGGYYAATTVRAASPHTGHERQCETRPDDEFQEVRFHNVDF